MQASFPAHWKHDFVANFADSMYFLLALAIIVATTCGLSVLVQMTSFVRDPRHRQLASHSVEHG